MSWFDFYVAYTHQLAFNADSSVVLVRRPQDIFTCAPSYARGRACVRHRRAAGERRYDFNAVTGAIMSPSPYTLLRITAQYDVVPPCSSSRAPRTS